MIMVRLLVEAVLIVTVVGALVVDMRTSHIRFTNLTVNHLVIIIVIEVVKTSHYSEGVIPIFHLIHRAKGRAVAIHLPRTSRKHNDTTVLGSCTGALLLRWFLSIFMYYLLVSCNCALAQPMEMILDE